MARESPFATLLRWEEAGAHWRLAWRTEDEVAVQLMSCLGEPVDELRSADPELRAYLERRPSSEE